MNNPTIAKLCSYSGLVAVSLIAIGFIAAGFIPIPPPAQTPEETAKMILENKNAIRFGMILSMAGAALLIPYSSALAVHMRRIEGSYSPLAYTQIAAGGILALEFIYLVFFWQTATFRLDRSAELIQLLNDMAWIPFVGLSSTLILQAIVFGMAVLIDKRAEPIYPRWLGFYSLFSAFMFLPGSFNVFFMSGPFSWNGLIAIYIPSVIYFFWTLLNCVYTAKANDRLHREGETAVN